MGSRLRSVLELFGDDNGVLVVQQLGRDAVGVVLIECNPEEGHCVPGHYDVDRVMLACRNHQAAEEEDEYPNKLLEQGRVGVLGISERAKKHKNCVRTEKQIATTEESVLSEKDVICILGRVVVRRERSTVIVGAGQNGDEESDAAQQLSKEADAKETGDHETREEMAAMAHEERREHKKNSASEKHKEHDFTENLHFARKGRKNHKTQIVERLPRHMQVVHNVRANTVDILKDDAGEKDFPMHS